ncbi:hypothetical protein [Promicromonospora sp. NPDC090134]|uniref:hypothetical protein n=1 Tax=Promicromonospora sp. NPDC090134 TaxID=3364408 RepID=UPI0038102F9A
MSNPPGGTTTSCRWRVPSRDALLGLDGFAAIDVSHRGEVTIVPTWSRRAWSAVSGAGPAPWGMIVTTSS